MSCLVWSWVLDWRHRVEGRSRWTRRCFDIFSHESRQDTWHLVSCAAFFKYVFRRHPRVSQLVRFFFASMIPRTQYDFFFVFAPVFVWCCVVVFLLLFFWCNVGQVRCKRDSVLQPLQRNGPHLLLPPQDKGERARGMK